jgi:hypothetical protein
MSYDETWSNFSLDAELSVYETPLPTAAWVFLSALAALIALKNRY